MSPRGKRIGPRDYRGRPASSPNGHVSVGWYCACGAMFQRVVPLERKGELYEWWTEVHSGPGHRPCDYTVAYRKRREEDEER